MIEPLLDKNVLIKVRDTKSMINDMHNFVFEINKEKLDIDRKKVKRLNF